MNFIPKIEYGPGPTTVTLEFPPEGDNLNEVEKSNVQRTISGSGIAQHQFNYTEQIIAVNLVFVTQALQVQLRTFFETWALKGNEFKYFEHSDLAGFITVTLDRFDYTPKRIIPDGSGGFIYDISLRMRRVI